MKCYSLSRKERIKSKKLFDLIYERNDVIISSDQKVKAVYIVGEQTEIVPVLISEAVSKKAGNAVWRNRVKRLLRESYRLNKNILVDVCMQKNISIAVVFAPYFLNQKKKPIVRLADLLPGVIDAMIKIRSSL